MDGPDRLRLLERAVTASTNSIVISDPNQPDDPIVYVNPAFERTTGYAAEEVLGRNCRFLQREDRDQPALGELRTAVREGRHCTVVLRNYRKNGALWRASSGLRSAIYDLRHEKERPFLESVESVVELNQQVPHEREIRLVVEEGFPVSLPGKESVELLRILQEALANVRRHSGARNVEVGLRTDDEAILIEVADDGRGFDPGSGQGGHWARGDARACRGVGWEDRAQEPPR